MSVTEVIVIPGGKRTTNLFNVVPVTNVKVLDPGVFTAFDGRARAYVLFPAPSDGVVIKVEAAPQNLVYLDVTTKLLLLILLGELPVSWAIPFHDCVEPSAFNWMVVIV